MIPMRKRREGEEGPAFAFSDIPHGKDISEFHFTSCSFFFWRTGLVMTAFGRNPTWFSSIYFFPQRPENHLKGTVDSITCVTIQRRNVPVFVMKVRGFGPVLKPIASMIWVLGR